MICKYIIPCPWRGLWKKEVLKNGLSEAAYYLSVWQSAGTIVCIALVGPVAGIFLPIHEKLVNKIVHLL